MRIAGLCERLHVLPNCGGLLDQDSRHLDKLALIFTVIDKKNQADTNG